MACVEAVKGGDVTDEIFNLDMDSSEDEASLDSSIYNATYVYEGKTIEVTLKDEPKPTKVESAKNREQESTPDSPLSILRAGKIKTHEKGRTFLLTRIKHSESAAQLQSAREELLETSSPYPYVTSLSSAVHSSKGSQRDRHTGFLLHENNQVGSDQEYSDSDYSDDLYDDLSSSDGEYESDTASSVPEYARPKEPVAPASLDPNSIRPKVTRGDSLFRRLEPLQYFRPVSTSPMAALFQSRQSAEDNPDLIPPSFRAPRSQNRAYGTLTSHPFHNAPVASDVTQLIPTCNPTDRDNHRTNDRQSLLRAGEPSTFNSMPSLLRGNSYMVNDRIYNPDVMMYHSTTSTDDSEDDSMWSDIAGLFCCLERRQRHDDSY